MKLELHIIQNFAPSNLNRDDTGSPKDCELGGVRRARISSQCLKRAIRETFEERALVPEGELAARTKRFIVEVSSRVIKAIRERDKTPSPENASIGDDPLFARVSSAVTRALESAGLKADPTTGKTQYLLYVPRRALDDFASLVFEKLDVLAPATKTEPSAPAEEGGAKGKQKAKKAEKSEAKDAADPEIRKKAESILQDARRTPELALFGRMIADAPQWNVDAACQVAHAISTHRVSMEFDFYTAIDDLKPEDTAGSDMMGTIPFNSACFYRYLAVDIGDLVKNLGADEEAKKQAGRTVNALVRAAVLAIPTGKQSSMAAQNLPSFVLATVSDELPPRSLANAFVEPVRPGREADLVTQSVLNMVRYAGALNRVYGAPASTAFIALEAGSDLANETKALGAVDAKSLDGLAKAVVAAAVGSSA